MTYQGHSSRAAWNVALWVANDEGLYRLACDHIRRARGPRVIRNAARAMLSDLHELGVTETPDGYRYTASSLEKALTGL